MKDKIIFGYDIITYNGPIPNCLPYEMVSTIKESSDYDFSNSNSFFQKKHNKNWPVFNSGFFNYGKDLVIKSVYEIRSERINNNTNTKWFYIIEPFGNLEDFFGNTQNYPSLIENISTIAIDEIINGNGNILINYIIDGGRGITKTNFLKLKNFFISKNIPDNKVYLIFQDFKLENCLKELETSYNFLNFNLALLSKSQEFYNTINNPNFTYWSKDAEEPQVGKIESKKSSIHTINILNKFIKDRKNSDLAIYDSLHPKKNFLFFCRHVRMERLLILNFLDNSGEQNSYYSWSKTFMNNSKNLVEDFIKITGNYLLANKFLNEDRVLDVTDITKIAGYGFEDSSLYKNSFLSIVGESIFYEIDSEFKTGYLSEKIWKPIGHCHPFVIIGPSKSLNYLKELGFKTFAPYIDESYDDIEDENLRLEKIIEILENFQNKSLDQKYDFLYSIEHILEHNFNHFLSFIQNEESYRNVYKKFFFNRTII